jgi:hypothetical protein
MSPTPVGIKPLGEGDVLDRLTPPEKKPIETPAADAAPVPTPAGEDTENKAAPAEDTPEDAPFKDADEAELAGYHSRTRHRIKQYKTELDRLRPAAKFGFDISQAAAERGIQFQSVIGWQNLGFGLRDKDPEAVQALGKILESHGYQPAGEPVAPDVTSVEQVVDKLFESMDINADARAKILATLAPIKKPAPAPVQQQQRAPAPQQQQAPQQNPVEQTVQWVAGQESQAAARVGAAKWPDVRKALYAEARRREAGLPLHLLNDPIEMRIRFAACLEHAVARASAPAAPRVQVQPTLRATPSPTPVSLPKRGTAEYDDYVMTHGVPA